MRNRRNQPTRSESGFDSLRRRVGPQVGKAASGIASGARRAATDVADGASSRLPTGKLRDFARQFDPVRIATSVLKGATGINVDTRERFTNAERRAIAQSQGWTCHYGDGALKRHRYARRGYVWQIDHKWPYSKGGSDKPENLVAACRKHNLAKRASNYTMFRAQLATDSKLRRCGNHYP